MHPKRANKPTIQRPPSRRLPHLPASLLLGADAPTHPLDDVVVRHMPRRQPAHKIARGVRRRRAGGRRGVLHRRVRRPGHHERGGGWRAGNDVHDHEHPDAAELRCRRGHDRYQGHRRQEARRSRVPRGVDPERGEETWRTWRRRDGRLGACLGGCGDRAGEKVADVDDLIGNK